MVPLVLRVSAATCRARESTARRSTVERLLARVAQEGAELAVHVSSVRAMQAAARGASDVLWHHTIEDILIASLVARLSKMIVRRSRCSGTFQGRARVATARRTRAVSSFRDSCETEVNLKCTIWRSSAGRFNR